jgi:hypothetical protein
MWWLSLCPAGGFRVSDEPMHSDNSKRYLKKRLNCLKETRSPVELEITEN